MRFRIRIIGLYRKLSITGLCIDHKASFRSSIFSTSFSNLLYLERYLKSIQKVKFLNSRIHPNLQRGIWNTKKIQQISRRIKEGRKNKTFLNFVFPPMILNLVVIVWDTVACSGRDITAAISLRGSVNSQHTVFILSSKNTLPGDIEKDNFQDEFYI